MELLKWSVRGLTLCGLAALVLHCAADPPADCGVICQQLARCHYLPSILGASKGTTHDVSAAEGDCEARCELSAASNEFQLVDACYKNHHGDSECGPLGQCLHERFPKGPVTGASNVTLTATDFDEAALVDAGCASESDAGAGILVRGFVQTWGTRSYGETRVCAVQLTDFLASVPADDNATAGFQFNPLSSGSGSCREISTAVSIPAGDSDLRVEVPMKGLAAPCPVEPKTSPSLADAATNAPETP